MVGGHRHWLTCWRDDTASPERLGRGQDGGGKDGVGASGPAFALAACLAVGGGAGS